MGYEPKIAPLMTQFQTGDLPRNDYWKAMQQHHLLVNEYTQLVRGDLLDHIEIHSDGLRVILKNGLHFVWNPHEIRIATSVLVNNGDYEKDELDVLLGLAQHCKDVLDIGANVGWYTLHLAQIIQPKGGVIHAFEPIPYTYEVLQRNLALNPAHQECIHTYNVALGETPGTVQFYIPAFQGSVAASMSTLYPEDENITVEGELAVLDDFAVANNIGNVDLFKCDVEGAEMMVLRGGMRLIEREKPILMLEMLRKWSAKFDYHPNDIIALLKDKGYSCWFYDDDAFQQLTAMDESVEALNFFFLHETQHAEILAQWENRVSVETWLGN